MKAVSVKIRFISSTERSAVRRVRWGHRHGMAWCSFCLTQTAHPEKPWRSRPHTPASRSIFLAETFSRLEDMRSHVCGKDQRLLVLKLVSKAAYSTQT